MSSGEGDPSSKGTAASDEARAGSVAYPRATCPLCQVELSAADRSTRNNHHTGPQQQRLCSRCLRVQQTSHRNHASGAVFREDAIAHPFSEGANRYAAKGKYSEGPRQGQACVCKWFKDGHTKYDTYFTADVEAMQKAVEIVEHWNRQKFISRIIQVNVPEIWTFQGLQYKGCKALLEPFVQNFTKFNSNTGWVALPSRDQQDRWPDVMSALSHFSYHTSNGHYLLCDLQGGITLDSIVLTDPVILSRGREYGHTDLGGEGILNFFANHVCNEFCRKEWSIPRGVRQFFDYSQSTSMMAEPARHRRYPPPPQQQQRRNQQHQQQPHYSVRPVAARYDNYANNGMGPLPPPLNRTHRAKRPSNEPHEPRRPPPHRNQPPPGNF